MDQSGETLLECSDDENYGFTLQKGRWVPPAQDIIRLYETIDRDGTLELEWQCPGRRPETPADVSYNHHQSGEDVKNENQFDDSGFDFEEDTSNTKLAVRPSGDTALKGSAKKKTTTFDGILSNMARHRKLNMIEDSNNSNCNG